MIPPSQARVEELWLSGEHKEVARWLPYFNKNKNNNSLITNLLESNLSKIKDKLDLPPLTLGADPEFILCEKGKPDKIIMFSSEYAGNKFGLSEAEIGADYGLLELRPAPSEDPMELVRTIIGLHREFNRGFTTLRMLKTEAVEFNHQLARIRDTLAVTKAGGFAPTYGGYRGKETAVWSANGFTGANNITIDETSNTSISAYGKPIFKKYRPDILSAGGHIHIGGTFVKCLSITQLNSLIIKIEEAILPTAQKLATPAGKLRETVYGSPGEYRIKEYGFEYRSLSNVIFHSGNAKILLGILQTIVDICKKHLI